jgi:RNA polymerase sigma factor (sigma-70 family)
MEAHPFCSKDRFNPRRQNGQPIRHAVTNDANYRPKGPELKRPRHRDTEKWLREQLADPHSGLNADIRRAAAKATRSRRREMDDLAQHIATSLLSRGLTFDPAFDTPTPYVRRVIRSIIASWLRIDSAHKRNPRTPFAELIDNDTPTSTDIRSADLRHDVQEAMGRLPPEELAVCERLGQESIRDIATRLKISRHAVQVRKQNILRIFEDLGLRDYL